jgi:hypothetical protein
VGGDLLANGDISLAAGSSVDNVTSIGGKVVRDPSAEVRGDVSAPSITLGGIGNDVIVAPPQEQEIERPRVPPVYSLAADGPHTIVDRIVALFSQGIFGLVLLLIGGLLAVLLPRRMSITGATLEAETGSSIVVGLIAALLLVPVVGFASVVLAITIIGVLFIPVLVIGVGLLLLFGLAVVGASLGKRVYDSTHQGGGYSNHLLLDVVLGMALILSAAFIPSVLIPGPISVLMFALLYFAACVGLGAAFLSRFGTLVPPRHGHRPGGYSHTYRATPPPYAQQPQSAPAASAYPGPATPPAAPQDTQPPPSPQ